MEIVSDTNEHTFHIFDLLCANNRCGRISYVGMDPAEWQYRYQRKEHYSLAVELVGRLRSSSHRSN